MNIQDSNISKTISSSITNTIKTIWESTLQWLTNKNDEVRVWEKTDQSGNAYWYVYNPKNGRSAHLSSETEVIGWIEGQYYL